LYKFMELFVLNYKSTAVHVFCLLFDNKQSVLFQ